MNSKIILTEKYYKKGYIDLPNLYKVYFTYSKGDQFRLLAELVRYVDDDWDKTYEYNTRRNFNWLVNIYKKSNIRCSIRTPDKFLKKRKFKTLASKHIPREYREDTIDREYEINSLIAATAKLMPQGIDLQPQIFDDLRAMPSNLNNTCDKIKTVCDDFHGLLNAIRETSKSAYKGVSSIFQPIILFICKMIALGYLLMKEQNQTVASVIALLTLIIPSGDGISQIAEGLIRVVQRIRGINAQASDIDDNEEGLFASFFTMTKNVFGGLFSDISKDEFVKMKISSTKMKMLSDYIRGATTILDFIFRLLDKIIQFIGEKILKYYGVVPWFLKEDRLTPLIDEFTKIKIDGIDVKAPNNQKCARQIVAFYNKIVNFESEFIKHCGKGTSLEKTRIMPYLRVMVKSMEETMEKIPVYLKEGKNSRRIKPFWLYIYGDPRVGKTSVFQPYVINALAKTLKIKDKYEDYSGYTYFRNCGDEFWERYVNQPVLWYNDLFQNYANDPAMHLAVLELTNVIDDNLYNLNMAFQNKGAIFFDSELVISNSQSGMIGLGAISNKCLSGGKHLHARRNMVAKFCLNPLYATSDGLIDHAKKTLAMQNNPQNNVADLFPKDMYTVEFQDPMTEQLIQKMSFTDAMKHICKTAYEDRKFQSDFKERLYNHFEDIWEKDLYAQGKDIGKKTTTNSFSNTRCPCWDTLDEYEDVVNTTVYRLRQCKEYQLWKRERILTFHTQHITDTEAYEACRFYYDKYAPKPRWWEPWLKSKERQETWEARRFPCFCIKTMNQTATLFSESTVGFDLIKSEEFINWISENLKPGHNCFGRDAAYKICKDLVDLKNNVPVVMIAHDEFHDASDFLLFNSPFEKVADNVLEDLIGNGHTYRCNNVFGDSTRKGYVQQFVAVNRELDEDLYARVTIVVESIGQQKWTEFEKQMSLQLFWSRFKWHASKWWHNLKDQITDFVGRNPRLSFFMFTALLTTIYTLMQTVQINREIRKVGETQNAIYEQYGKLSYEEFCEYMQKNFSYAPTAESCEGDKKPPQRQIQRVKYQPPHVVTTQSYDQQNYDVEKKFTKNMCKIGCSVDVEGVEKELARFGSALGIGGDVFVMPRHFWFRIKQLKQLYKEKNMNFYVFIEWNQKLKQKIHPKSIEVVELNYQHCMDLIYFRIKNLICLPHLEKYFISCDAIPSNLFECYLYGFRSGDYTPTMLAVHGVHLMKSEYEHDSVVEPVTGTVLPSTKIDVPKTFKYYNCHTSVGDCGMILCNTDSKANAKKLMGMHTAGNNAHAIGVSNLIFCEDIDEINKTFFRHDDHFEMLAEEQFGPILEATSKIAVPLSECGLDIMGKAGVFENPFNGKTRPIKLTIPRKTKINKSVMYDIMAQDFGPAKTMPAVLSRVNVDGYLISPIVKAAQKLAVAGPALSPDEIDPVVQHMTDTFMGWRCKYEKRTLTDYEMLNGYGSLKQMDMSTSPGFPYTLIDNTKGKLPFVIKTQENPAVFELGPYLAERLRKREDDARNGKFEPVFFADTLKDETRPIAKVLQCKTRLFQVAPMEYNMLLRKYFGSFIAMCHDNFIDSEISIGINPNSYDWTMLVDRLKNVGNRYGAGDCSNHDASCLQQILMYICDGINKWYGEGPENSRIRKVLFLSFLNSLHIIEDVVFRMIQGNKSGIALTTIINCLMEMFIPRLAYYRKYKTLVGYSENLSSCIYGDDIVNALSKMLSEQLDPTDIMATYRSLGFDYTTVDKQGENNKYYNLDEITFLKRKFTWDDELRLYKAQLDKDVIYEICRWSESDPHNMEDQLNRINSSLLELSNYDRQEFDNYREKMVEYCAILNQTGFDISIGRIFDWNYCQKIKFPEHF